MGRHHRIGPVRRQKKVKPKGYPQIFLDKANDFAAIKIRPGIEKNSYLKDGFLFSEDQRGQIIEIQILNLSQLVSILDSRSVTE